MSSKHIHRRVEYHNLDDSFIQVVSQHLSTKAFHTRSKLIRGYPTHIIVDDLCIMFASFERMIERQQYKMFLRDYIQAASQLGYRAMVVFQDEWHKNAHLVIKKIRHAIGISDLAPIFARKCKIINLHASEAELFIDQHHLSGVTASQPAYVIGATFNDELVAVATFTIPIVHPGQKQIHEGSYELSRIATHSSYRIPNITPRLLRAFQQTISWNRIYSFADMRYGRGSMYPILGLNYVDTNPPEFHYVKDWCRVRNATPSFLRNLPNYNPLTSVYDNMTQHGYQRIWGAGAAKFEIRNPNAHEL